MKHIEQTQQEIEDFHVCLTDCLCLFPRLFIRRLNVDRFGLRAFAPQHAQFVLRQIADALAASGDFKLLRQLFVCLLYTSDAADE